MIDREQERKKKNAVTPCTIFKTCLTKTEWQTEDAWLTLAKFHDNFSFCQCRNHLKFFTLTQWISSKRTRTQKKAYKCVHPRKTACWEQSSLNRRDTLVLKNILFTLNSDHQINVSAHFHSIVILFCCNWKVKLKLSSSCFTIIFLDSLWLSGSFETSAKRLGSSARKPDVAREKCSFSSSVALQWRFIDIENQVNLITFIRSTSYYTGKKNWLYIESNIMNW